jgi:hypothetical protein
MSRGLNDRVSWATSLAAAFAAAAMFAGLFLTPAPAAAAARAKSAWTRDLCPTRPLEVVVVPASRLPLVDFRLVARAPGR